MKRILVGYYSRSGHTEFVAQQIAAHCHADLEPIMDSQHRQGARGYLRSAMEALFGWRPAIERARRRAADYVLVILGTPVHGGRSGCLRARMAPQARQPIPKHPLNNTPYPAPGLVQVRVR